MYNEVFAIILAGGSGTRFGNDIKKQFYEFHGKALWRHIYDTVVSVLPNENVVVVGVDIEGGATRPESVKIGLEWCANRGGCKRVVCLEAARALVTREQLMQVIELESPSCCFVNPVVDTVVLTDKTYLTRSECRHLVSPQAFDFNLLYKAYMNCDLSEIRTDETRLMFDTYGIKPDFLDGGENLYKVTYPKDIAVLEVIWNNLHKNEIVFNTGETSAELKAVYNPEGSLLRNAQLRMLDMLNYLDEVCKAQGIPYRFDGGTCLGALRHKGFIPWDDDLDIVFPRKEWKRLVKYLMNHPHPHYQIQCHNTDSGYMGAWAILRDTNSEYIQDSKIHNARKYRGLQVDLFPYDLGNLKCLQHAAYVLNNISVNRLINRGHMKLANLCWHINYGIIFPIFRLFNIFGDRKASSHSYGTSWYHKEKHYFKLEEVWPYKPIEFEGNLYPGPAQPEKILERIYGDYMSIPPKDNRNHHNAEYIMWE